VAGQYDNPICCTGPPVCLQRTNTENSKQIFPEKELRGHSPNFHIYVSVSDLYIPTIDLPILLQEMLTDPVNHGRRNFKDTNPLMSFSLVILFGVLK
jgi:hypothetical protein